MKQITTFLKELRTILDDNNYSNAVVVDLSFTLTEFDVLAVEASFAVRHPNGKTDVIICNSNIDNRICYICRNSLSEILSGFHPGHS